jgi:Zn-dependent protease with chaperone function
VIAALVLVGYAVVLATLGARWLDRAAWTGRAPRLGIVAWQALAVSVLGAAVLGGLALTVSTTPISGNLAGWLRACVMAVRAQYATPGGAAAGASGAILALAVLARVGWCLAVTLRSAARARARQREALAVLGHAAAGLSGVTVVDSPLPVAYCLPGRGSRVVLSNSALTSLNGEQLRAVLAHERAHLDARHDLANAVAGALARAFPRLPAFSAGARQIARLAEMSADDAAARSTHRLDVAEALLTLAVGRAPAAALGAGGPGAGERVRRIIAAPAPLGRARRWSTAGLTATLLLAPLLLVAAPAAVAAQLNYCPNPPTAHAVTAAQTIASSPGA